MRGKLRLEEKANKEMELLKSKKQSLYQLTVHITVYWYVYPYIKVYIYEYYLSLSGYT